AVVLFLYNLVKLPETQKERQSLQLGSLSLRMLKDSHIWFSALLVALYNIALFSYSQLGAFTFAGLGFSSAQFGYTGVVLGLGTLLGSYLNKTLLSKQVSQRSLLWISAMLLTIGAIGVYAMQGSIWFLAPMMLVVM
ncbi:MFS transporter, partial [Vibrio anguillarum]|nr:MFS transporter [Vibrio anguillarum]